MTGIAGLRGTGDWGTDERPKNFREMILWRNPNGNTPIFGLTAKVQKESTDDAEFSWWDEPNDLVRLQVNGTVAVGETTIVVDSADPSTSAPGNAWGNATHLVPGDLLLVEPAADNATYDHEIVKVESVISATQFTVSRGAAGTTPAEITNDLYLLKIGSVFAEGTGTPSSASRNPIKYYNFAQIFKTTYEVTKTAAATRTRTGDVLKNERMRKRWDHSRDIELSLLFGQRNETTGANGKPLRSMGGLRTFIPAATTTVFGTTVTVDSFYDAVYPVFDYDTPAGDTRMAFCGNGALNILNKLVQGTAGTSMELGSVVKVFGMNFREFILPQGRILMRTHPLLNRHALYTNSMFLIDFSALRYRPMKGRDTDFQDNIQNKGEDVIRGQWLTEAGFEVRYGGLTCGYLGAFQ